MNKKKAGSALEIALHEIGKIKYILTTISNEKSFHKLGNKSGKNVKYQFEYVNGAIEHSFVDESEEGILFKRGIRQHVCDVLEGGEEAFEKREIKYGLK